MLIFLNKWWFLARGLEKFQAKLFKKLSKLLGGKAFIDSYTTNEKTFSRGRVLSFKTVTLLIL